MLRLRYAPILFAALVCSHEPAMAQAQPSRGLPNLSQVDDHVYRGGQPTREGLEQLVHMGVRTVLDLRGPSERSDTEKHEALTLGLRYINVALPSLSAPTPEEVARALAVLSAPESREGWPVYVHCMRGKDRTGTVIACYRMAHSRWSREQALGEARKLGLSLFEPAMIRFIREYTPPPAPPAAAIAAGPAAASATRAGQ